MAPLRMLSLCLAGGVGLSQGLDMAAGLAGRRPDGPVRQVVSQMKDAWQEANKVNSETLAHYDRARYRAEVAQRQQQDELKAARREARHKRKEQVSELQEQWRERDAAKRAASRAELARLEASVAPKGA
eukprot:CAMPEP_0204576902 /NCGR_PEP_ID=MMETSP0661-20131031/42044_1 /ASSEMBLY_ACC=CAM_ASM_000606 /TAXON_ID=109239 /ORGANISM="Alexandrium margalefi, Strain AMGDE01CS-322" /LENGTH=128 /DNA_ID=CAMNT_0051585699 /DNA_START=69 /DNA_END=455 /DNA_ORIENTATION=+